MSVPKGGLSPTSRQPATTGATTDTQQNVNPTPMQHGQTVEVMDPTLNPLTSINTAADRVIHTMPLTQQPQPSPQSNPVQQWIPTPYVTVHARTSDTVQLHDNRYPIAIGKFTPGADILVDSDNDIANVPDDALPVVQSDRVQHLYFMRCEAPFAKPHGYQEQSPFLQPNVQLLGSSAVDDGSDSDDDIPDPGPQTPIPLSPPLRLGHNLQQLLLQEGKLFSTSGEGAVTIHDISSGQSTQQQLTPPQSNPVSQLVLQEGRLFSISENGAVNITPQEPQLDFPDNPPNPTNEE